MKIISALFAIIVLGVGAGAIVRALSGGGAPAPTPEVFLSQPLSLTEAIAEGRQTGRPVVAVAGAEWCGPCQNLKRTTLSHPQVQQWLRDNAIAVYVDVDKDGEGARLMEVSAIPHATVYVDGKAASVVQGYQGPEAFLGWLKQAAPGTAG